MASCAGGGEDSVANGLGRLFREPCASLTLLAAIAAAP